MGGESPHSVKSGQFLGVPAVGLNAVPGFFRDEGWCDDIAGNPPGIEDPVQFEAVRASLVNTADISELLKPSHQPVDSFVCVGEFEASPNALGIVPDGSNNYALLVDVHSDPGDRIVHDRSLLYCGSGRVRARLTHVITRWGRSLHNV
jgi:hypothetical protein